MWYIYVSSVDLAKQRVLARVANGGHGIPDEVIERRSATSLQMLQTVVPLCDEVRVYDNTTAFTPVARIICGRFKAISRTIPPEIVRCLTKHDG